MFIPRENCVEYFRKEFPSSVVKKKSPVNTPGIEPLEKCLKVAKVFGIFLINSQYQFSYKSLYFCYPFILIMSVVFLMFVSLYQQLITEISRAKISNTFFHLFNLSICINFVQIARQWKVYMIKWSKINKSFKALMIVDVRAKETESRLFQWFMAFNASYSLPRFLYLLKTFGLTSSCYSERKGDTPTLPYIFYEMFPDFTNIIPPNIFIGVYFFFLDICMTFSGVFNESLILLLSQLITRRFELLNETLSTGLQKNKSQRFWLDHIAVYKELCKLVSVTNDLVGFGILIAFSKNMYYICVTLLISMSSLFGMFVWESAPSFIELSTYCWRMSVLILHAAKVYETSSETSEILNEIPADNSMAEISYFREYLATNRVVLTGCGYFALTKRLMLTLTGTLVTYQLVLIQFYDQDIKTGNFTGCIT